MRYSFGRWLCATAVVLGLSSEAFALRVAIQVVQPQQAAAKADIVIIGKIVEIEKEPSVALNVPKGTTMNYRIAVLKIEEAIGGAKGLTQVRVGFSETPKIATEAQPANPAPVPNGVPLQNARPLQFNRIPPPFNPPIVLMKDQEGMFFLRKHHSGDFLVPMAFTQVVAKTQEDFKKQVESVKKIRTIVASPTESLQAKDKKDRELAACTLVGLYANPSLGFGQEVVSPTPQLVSLEESKLILDALAGMEWGTFDAENQIGLQNVWYSLNPMQYGWKQPMFQGAVQQADVNAKMTESVREFLKENAGKIRLKKLVLADK